VAGARWPEFDFDAKLWTVPPERFKSNSKHIVPLTGDVLGLLCALPRFKSGDCLFSSSFGKAPADSFFRWKTQLDDLMLEELRKIDSMAKLPPFVTHDLRRTLRTSIVAACARYCCRDGDWARPQGAAARLRSAQVRRRNARGA
jgi:integrase